MVYLTVTQHTSQNKKRGKKRRPDKHVREPNNKGIYLPYRATVIGSVVAVLLCGVFVVNFFQMLSISRELRRIKAEIDSLKTNSIVSAVEPTVNQPTEKAMENETATASQIEDTSTEITTQMETYSEKNSKLLLVNQVVSLYKEPSLTSDIVGYVAPDNSVSIISNQNIDDCIWVKVKTSSETLGWALYEYFTET